MTASRGFCGLELRQDGEETGVGVAMVPASAHPGVSSHDRTLISYSNFIYGSIYIYI